MDEILSYFTFENWEIIALSVLLLLFLIRIASYFLYYKKPYSYIKKKMKDAGSAGSSSDSVKPKVSVIIASENEAYELQKNLPAILSQDYPDYEVIVVNNGSTDESEDLLQSLKLQYPHLYFTYLPHAYDRNFTTRKLAITLGVKAASGEVLMFTEPYSKPVSNRWISSVMEKMSDDKEVVLGYSFYTKTKQFFNRIARFDNHLYSMQYLSMALKGSPYTGTYRNVAYRKHLFFDKKGFSSYLHLDNAEDMFINQIVNKNNTAVVLSQDSFIETNLGSFSLWKQIKKSYSVTKSYFKGGASVFLKFDAFTRYLFYLLAIGLVVYGAITSGWALLGIAALLFLVKLIIEFVVLNKPAKYFKSGKFYFSFILMDFLQPLYNLRFRTRGKNKIIK